MVDYKGYHCTPGYYCPAGSTSNTDNPCPEGTYTDRYDLHNILDCSICPRGFKCPSAATSSDFLECGEHQYCPLGTGSSETYYCPTGFKYSLTPNALGTFNAMSLEDCQPCDAGFYCEAGLGE